MKNWAPTISAIPMGVVAASSSFGSLGAVKAATPTMITPATIMSRERMWWMYCLRPRNYQAKNAVMMTMAPLII